MSYQIRLEESSLVSQPLVFRGVFELKSQYFYLNPVQLDNCKIWSIGAQSDFHLKKSTLAVGESGITISTYSPHCNGYPSMLWWDKVNWIVW